MQEYQPSANDRLLLIVESDGVKYGIGVSSLVDDPDYQPMQFAGKERQDDPHHREGEPS